MNTIPYGHQTIDENDIRSVETVLKSDWLTTGPKVPEFEQNISEYIGCRHSVAVNSGTSALDIAVNSLNLSCGDEVISTPFTFAATNNALLYHGIRPVFADIEKETRNIDPDQIRKKITPRTKAIMFVDFAGHPCRIDEIREIARENNLFLIEDACHSFGAKYKGKKVGRFADMTIFSFHPVKLFTTGEGGAVVTDNDELAGKLRLFRNHGIDRSAGSRFGAGADWAYDMVELGRNYRMTDIQAALGISQLKKIDAFLAKRNDIARRYLELFDGMGGTEIPVTSKDIYHSWHLFTVLLSTMDRGKFYSFMKKQNIGVNVHYIPTYRFSYYQKNLPTNPADFPVTEDVFNRIITLPLYPGLSDEDIQFVVQTVKTAFRQIS